MSVAELLFALEQEIRREIQSWQRNATVLSSKSFFAILDPTGRRTVMVTFKGDEEPLAITVRMEAEPSEVARWSPSLGDPWDGLILSGDGVCTLNEAAAKLQRWFQEP
jgi:hypothetical protein